MIAIDTHCLHLGNIVVDTGGANPEAIGVEAE